FNTHHIKYHQLNLEQKLKNISHHQKLQLLPSHPIFLKPPLPISPNHFTLPFKQNHYQHQSL
ncbi:thioredoxin domain-containing protein, partial [Staphylococcus epidermidis]